MAPSIWRRVEKLSIALPADLIEAVRAAVESGRYASVSEVIRDALRDWRLENSALKVAPARVRPPPASDLTPAQLFEIQTLGRLRRIERFAVRGSAQKRQVDAAIAFRPPLPYGWTPEEARCDTQAYLSFRWVRQVRLVMYDSVENPAEWTIVYEADFPGRETESSSTS